VGAFETDINIVPIYINPSKLIGRVITLDAKPILFTDKTLYIRENKRFFTFFTVGGSRYRYFHFYLGWGDSVRIVK
jgi:hypothetical protein